MINITEHIRNRRSVRTFDGRVLGEDVKEKLSAFMKDIENPFGIPVDFKFLDAKEDGLTCPVVSGTDCYVGGKVKDIPNASVAFGFSFEVFVLYAQSLSLGTVWLGGTMNRPAFEQAMGLRPDEMMPCASPLGYPAKKMALRENLMRKAIKADERLPFEELFFDGNPDTPLIREKAGCLAESLEMVRLAPSAVNKQPWRVVVADDTAHFYLKRSRGFGHEGKLDMQMIDLGIALCHFALTAEESGLKITFLQEEPVIVTEGMEYVGSYRVEQFASRKI